MTDNREPLDSDVDGNTNEGGCAPVFWTLVTLAPLILTYFLMFFMQGDSQGMDGVEIGFILVIGGAVLAGVIIVVAICRSSRPLHPVLLFLIFIVVVVAYLTLGFLGGCYAAILGDS